MKKFAFALLLFAVSLCRAATTTVVVGVTPGAGGGPAMTWTFYAVEKATPAPAPVRLGATDAQKVATNVELELENGHVWLVYCVATGPTGLNSEPSNVLERKVDELPPSPVIIKFVGELNLTTGEGTIKVTP